MNARVRAAALAGVVAGLLTVSGCQKKDPVIVEVDAAVFVNPFPSLVDRPIPSAPTTDTLPTDGLGIVDLFDDDATDAGSDRLTTKPGFFSYKNERFGFSLDVPNALVSKGPFADGSGNHWELGKEIALTAVASTADALPGHLCPTGPKLERKETESECATTGENDGMMFSERHVVKDGNDFRLVFEYRKELEKRLAPMLAHVQKSWTVKPPR